MSLSSAPRPAAGVDPAADQAAPHLKFRPDVEGLRCVAVLMVVLDHLDVPGFSGGFIGVDVFFVISGFLITSLLRDEFARNVAASLSGRATISFEGFYLRRAKRILPAALTVIAVVLLAAKFLFTEVRFAQVQADALWATFFGANIQLMHQATDYFAQTDLVSPLQNFWSLAVEEQFYIVWPALFLFAARLPEWTGKQFDWRRSARIGAAIVGVASLGWSIYATATSPGSAYFSTLTRAWELAIGAGIALSPRLLRLSRGAAAHALAWLGAGLLLAGLVLISPKTGYPGLWALFPAVGCAFLIIAGLSGETTTPVASGLSLRGPRWIGRISYSLYLWHWPIIVFAVALFPKGATTVPIKVVLFGLSIGAAYLSYTFLEQPYRHLSLPKEPMARMQFLSDSRDRLIKMGAAGLLVVAVIAVFARPSHQTTSALADANTPQLEKWATWQGDGATSASRDVPTQSEWTDAVASAAASKQVPESAFKSASQSKALTPQGFCWNVVNAAQVAKCTLYGVNQATQGWPSGENTTVALVGNSFAAQWTRELQWSLPSGTKLVPLVAATCDPASATTNHAKNIHNVDCGAQAAFVEKQLRRLKPNLVVLSNTWDSTAADMGGLVSRLAASTPHLLWIGPAPSAPNFSSCLTSRDNLSKCNGPTPGSQLAGERDFADQARTHGATFLDLAKVYCSGAICPAIVSNEPVRTDGKHLSEPAMRGAESFLTSALMNAMDHSRPH